MASYAAQHREPQTNRTLPIRSGLRARTCAGGGRMWWARLMFTRINIELTFLENQVEDVREAGASKSIAR